MPVIEWPQGLQVEIYESTDAFLQQFRSSRCFGKSRSKAPAFCF